MVPVIVDKWKDMDAPYSESVIKVALKFVPAAALKFPHSTF